MLLNIAEKHIPVHGTINDGRSGEAADSQRSDEGCCLPVTVRNSVDDALAAEGAAMQPGKFGVGPKLVEKDQVSDVEVRLPESPALAAISHVRTQLLRRMNYFF